MKSPLSACDVHDAKGQGEGEAVKRAKVFAGSPVGPLPLPPGKLSASIFISTANWTRRNLLVWLRRGRNGAPAVSPSSPWVHPALSSFQSLRHVRPASLVLCTRATPSPWNALPLDSPGDRYSPLKIQVENHLAEWPSLNFLGWVGRVCPPALTTQIVMACFHRCPPPGPGTKSNQQILPK